MVYNIESNVHIFNYNYVLNTFMYKGNCTTVFTLMYEYNTYSTIPRNDFDVFQY